MFGGYYYRNFFAFFRPFCSSIPTAGGDKRDRTADLLLARQALSQLSYTPMLLSLKRKVTKETLFALRLRVALLLSLCWLFFTGQEIGL